MTSLEDPGATTIASSAAPAARIVIVDADPLFVESVTPTLEALGMVVIAGLAHGEASWKPIRGSDVVLVDADGQGDDVSPHTSDFGGARRVLLSATLDHEQVRVAFQQGYRGAISKNIALHRFGTAILSVLQGHLVVEVEPQRPGTVLRRTDISQVVADSLTPREREVLTLLVEGASGAEIGETLSLSSHTVRTHVQNVMSKLQVHSRVEAVAYAVRHHIVHPSGNGSPDEVA